MLMRTCALALQNAAIAACLLSATSARSAAADPPGLPPPSRPLQTELLGPLDLSRAREGALVLARVDLDWSAPTCRLRAGSIVQGRITHFDRRTKSNATSTIHLLFNAAACNGQPSTPFAFSLIALVGPTGGTSRTGQSGVSEAPPLAQAPGLAIGGSGGTGTLRSAAQASNINTFTLLPARSLPSTIVPGQVVDIARTNLSVGTGVAGATVISGLKRDVRLEQSTSLILVPTAILAPSLEAGAGASPQKPSVARGVIPGTSATLPPPSTFAAPDTTPPDETELCSASCHTVAPLGSSETGTAAIAALPIRALGYAPHDLQPRAEFNNETTLTWLGDHDLLCTFDPHELRPRPNPSEEDARDIRAVLIDPATRTVTRVLRWHVRGSDRYLWPISSDRVAVHIGKSLRIFGPGLQQLGSIPVNGPIAYVVASPSGDHLLVGVAQPRFPAAVYRELQENLAEAPEEEVDLRIFDQKLNLLASLSRSSRSPAPVLSDSGELRLTQQGTAHRWKLSEFRWDRTEHLIQTLKSDCRPALSTPQHDLIFAVGCTGSGSRWYRMLRSDGRPLLKGESTFDEIAQTALANPVTSNPASSTPATSNPATSTSGHATAADLFAVRIVKAARPMSFGQPFNRLDLTRERIALFRSSDGQPLGNIVTADFALAQSTFAIAPSGNTVALLGKTDIQFYRIAPAR